MSTVFESPDVSEGCRRPVGRWWIGSVSHLYIDLIPEPECKRQYGNMETFSVYYEAELRGFEILLDVKTADVTAARDEVG